MEEEHTFIEQLHIYMWLTEQLHCMEGELTFICG